MEVYALVGPSGTGKSHHATDLADELQISYIIDDGLLIHNGRKIAGQSAKNEPTMVAAVKRAIFLDQDHAESVRKALALARVKRLLILGTSEHMIDRIVGALQLPPVKQVIFIQDVATEKEIEIAKAMRSEGKHVIPLPVVEVRKELPTGWIDPVISFFKRKSKDEQARVNEKSIVRPVFSQLGKVIISEHVFIGLARHIALEAQLFGPNPKITVRTSDLGATIQMESRVRYGVAIQREVMAFQKNVMEEIEMYTGVPVRTVNVRISGVIQ
ncbi:MAG: Asp23/Gls24 family envelope stress response protein [Peptococcaceae bacterium]|nr:Asp23/Gls24 family envelope stress response protein [Peptococcaceae bacterium]